jgi:hypothetical protein
MSATETKIELLKRIAFQAFANGEIDMGQRDALIDAYGELLAASQAVLDEFPALDGKRIESVKRICRAAIAKAVA